MKVLIISSVLALLTSTSSFASSSVTNCSSPEGSSSFSAGVEGEIKNINSLKLTINSYNEISLQLNVSGLTDIDLINNKDTVRTFVEDYQLKEMKNGGMMEFSSSKNNQLKLDAVFLELGDLDTLSVGPVFPGTYNQIISLAVIDSNIFYMNPSPMTVKKFVLKCKTTIK